MKEVLVTGASGFIGMHLVKELSSQGYKVRVYVPFGKDWLGYVYRRLRERKENLFFVFCMYVSNLMYGINADNYYVSLLLELVDYKLNPHSTSQQRKEMVHHFSRFVRSNANPERICAPSSQNSSRYIYAYNPVSEGAILTTPLIIGSFYINNNEDQPHAIVHLNMPPPKPIQYLQELNEIITLEALPNSPIITETLEALFKK